MGVGEQAIVDEQRDLDPWGEPLAASAGPSTKCPQILRVVTM